MSKRADFRFHKMGGHDAEDLKNCWEKVILDQTKQQEDEESRLSKSALKKLLHHKWTMCLENQARQIQAHMKMQKGQMTMLSIEAFPSPDKNVA